MGGMSRIFLPTCECVAAGMLHTNGPHACTALFLNALPVPLPRQVLKLGIPFDTVVKIQKINFLVLETLLDPLLVPLWGPFWTPFGLHVGPFGDSWGLQLDPFGHFWGRDGNLGMTGSAMKFTEWSGPFTSSIIL